MSEQEEFTETPKTRGFNSNKILFWGGSVVAIGLGLAIYALTQAPGGVGDDTPDATFSNDNKKKPQPQNVGANDDEINKIINSSDTPAVKVNTTGTVVVESPTETSEVPPLTGKSNIVTQQDTTQDELQKQLIQTRNQAIVKQEQNRIAAYSAKTLVMSQQKQNSSDGVSNLGSPPQTKSNSSAPENEAGKDGYSMAKLIKVKSQWFLKAGTILPCVMISGLNSENSGNIVAMITENIYDSRYGKKILVPQGSTIMGLYNNNVAFGNSRIVPAFKTLTYPDGSIVDLQGLPGSDLSGFTGLSDQVDNHYWQLFGTSFIMGVITAGMQYSQNNTNANVQAGGIGYTNPNPSVGQTLSGSLGQQLGQTGLAITNKQLNVAPTIIIRQHATFTIMLASALVLPPYSGE